MGRLATYAAHQRQITNPDQNHSEPNSISSRGRLRITNQLNLEETGIRQQILYFTPKQYITLTSRVQTGEQPIHSRTEIACVRPHARDEAQTAKLPRFAFYSLVNLELNMNRKKTRCCNPNTLGGKDRGSRYHLPPHPLPFSPRRRSFSMPTINILHAARSCWSLWRESMLETLASRKMFELTEYKSPQTLICVECYLSSVLPPDLELVSSTPD